jgi:hypothetical protein
MEDLLVLALIVAFFAACTAYVRLCDRIIGPDPASVGTPDGTGGDLASAGEPHLEEVARP